MRQTRPGDVVVKKAEELNAAADTRWAVAEEAAVQVVSVALAGVALEVAVPEGAVSTQVLAPLQCRGSPMTWPAHRQSLHAHQHNPFN